MYVLRCPFYESGGCIVQRRTYNVERRTQNAERITHKIDGWPTALGVG